jgi:hypothetical protein
MSGDEEEMATTEERLTILRMIEQGKISAEEGARLLAALSSRQRRAAPSPASTDPLDTSRALNIRVYTLVNSQPRSM